MPRKAKKKSKSRVNEAGNYTKPSMRKRLFSKIKAGSKGGKPGQWSARKAQLLAKEYKAKVEAINNISYAAQRAAIAIAKKKSGKYNKAGKRTAPYAVKRTGKKPKGSGRRLYTDENPKDTVSIKFATPADARATVAKVKRIRKPYARKIQILTVLEQRAKVAGKNEQARIAKKGKEAIRKKHKGKK